MFDLSEINWSLFRSIRTEFFDQIYETDRLSPLFMQVQDKAQEGEPIDYPYIKDSTTIAQPWRATGLARQGSQNVSTISYLQRRLEVNYSVNGGLLSGELGKSIANLIEKFKYSEKKLAQSQEIVMHVAAHIINKLREERTDIMLLHGVHSAKPAPGVVGTPNQIYDGLFEIKRKLVANNYTPVLPMGEIPATATAGQDWKWFEQLIKEIPRKIRKMPITFLLPSIFFDRLLSDLIATNRYEAQLAFSTEEYRKAKEAESFVLPGYPNIYVQSEETMDLAHGVLGWVRGNAQIVHHEARDISETLMPLPQYDGKEVVIVASKHEAVAFANPILVFTNK